MYGEESVGRNNKRDGCMIELIYTSGKEMIPTKKLNLENITVALDKRQANIIVRKVNFILGPNPDRDDWLSEENIIKTTNNRCTQMYYETFINVWYEVAKAYRNQYNQSN
jgi:hypothetical protein